MKFGDFLRVKEVLDAKLGPDVQALALAWTVPFRVECMSVTAAFALGFDPASYCAEGCYTTKPSPYFNSSSYAPFTDHRIRPAMLLATTDVESAKRLIDRGLRSDETWPEGKAYLHEHDDSGRNVRAETYERVEAALGSAYPIEQVDADALEGKSDIMFEFTGVARVAAMTSNRFLDGAMADHLTSWGGGLVGHDQTTALDWLSAGATGSYGTSTEPCNFRAKFPDVGVVDGALPLAARRSSRRTGRASSCRARGSSSAIRWRGPSVACASATSARRHRGLDPRPAARQLPPRGVAQQHRAVPGDPCGPHRRASACAS